MKVIYTITRIYWIRWLPCSTPIIRLTMSLSYSICGEKPLLLSKRKELSKNSNNHSKRGMKIHLQLRKQRQHHLKTFKLTLISQTKKCSRTINRIICWWMTSSHQVRFKETRCLRTTWWFTLKAMMSLTCSTMLQLMLIKKEIERIVTSWTT